MLWIFARGAAALPRQRFNRYLVRTFGEKSCFGGTRGITLSTTIGRGLTLQNLNEVAKSIASPAAEYRLSRLKRVVLWAICPLQSQQLLMRRRLLAMPNSAVCVLLLRTRAKISTDLIFNGHHMLLGGLMLLHSHCWMLRAYLICSSPERGGLKEWTDGL